MAANWVCYADLTTCGQSGIASWQNNPCRGKTICIMCVFVQQCRGPLWQNDLVRTLDNTCIFFCMMYLFRSSIRLHYLPWSLMMQSEPLLNRRRGGALLKFIPLIPDWYLRLWPSVIWGCNNSKISQILNSEYSRKNSPIAKASLLSL